MTEVKEFKPSTKERPKPEKPADIVDIEVGRKKKEIKERFDTSSVLTDALELIEMGQMTDEEIDALGSINENEKILLKIIRFVS